MIAAIGRRRFGTVTLVVVTLFATTALITANDPARATTTAKNLASQWVSTVNPKALVLGDTHMSLTNPGIGTIFSCVAPGGGGGSFRDGPWIHGTTWDSTTKLSVLGVHNWPLAKFTITKSSTRRNISTNDLPVGYSTGTFPIASTDQAFAYDRNPNSIHTQTVTLSVPLIPVAAARPKCLGRGEIGVLLNGVELYDGLDALNRDAVAHEIQDACSGHPDQSRSYHYHDVPSCLIAATKGTSVVVGWARDGYPIVVERDAKGALPTNKDLDVCHGRVSTVSINGKSVITYHYDATLEFPYTLGCYHGSK